jgi:hypothetical protein
VLFRSVSANPATNKDEMPATMEQVLEQINKECSLSAEQHRQIQVILDETVAEYHRAYEPVRPLIEPKFEAARQAGRQKIRGVLTPEQLPKFEAYVRHLDDLRKKQDNK